MLIQSLPSDVEQYIMTYLIMPLDVEKLRRVSKKVRNLVNNSKYIIEKNKITENIHMLIEDDYFIKYKHEMNPIYLNSLADCWNKYYKWNWERPTNKKVIEDYWTIGDFVDAKDRIDIWGPAYISDIKIEPSENDYIETRRLYQVEFLGWDSAFDEWIPIDKIKKLGTMTLNPIKPYESLHTENKHWVIFNNNKKWSIYICKKITDDNKKITVKFQKFRDITDYHIVNITKENISLYVKPCTNVSAFLTIENSNFKIYNRKILM